MLVPIDIQLRRLDEHRIRVSGVGPAGLTVNGNGWETEPSDDGAFAFNCMAYSDASVRLLVTVEGRHQSYHAFVADLGVGESVPADIGDAPNLEFENG